MRNKVIIILSIATVFNFIYSCCGKCDPATIYKYEITSLAVKNIDLNKNTSERDSASKDSFGLNIILKGTVIAFHSTNWWSSNALYATSCPDCDPDAAVTDDAIKSLKIISLDNWNDSFPKNTDITSKFRRYLGMSTNFFLTTPIDSGLATLRYSSFNTKYPETDFHLILQDTSTSTQTANLQVQLTLNSGKRMIVNNRLIHLY